MQNNIVELVVMQCDKTRFEREALVVMHPTIWSRCSLHEMVALGARYERDIYCRRMASGRNLLTLETSKNGGH